MSTVKKQKNFKISWGNIVAEHSIRGEGHFSKNLEKPLLSKIVKRLKLFKISIGDCVSPVQFSMTRNMWRQLLNVF